MDAPTRSAPALGALEPAGLLADAREAAGLQDFGDEGFLEPLEKLVTAVVQDAGLSANGTIGARMSLIRCLVNRLRMQADLTAHPEILDEQIARPLVIVGLPRTGTSKLQRMICADDGVQRLYLWRLLNPAPLPGWERGEPDGRVELARQHEQALGQSPDFAALHPMQAEVVDEDAFLMELAFEGILPLVQYRVPSFHSWTTSRSRSYFYGYEKQVLQYLQWQEGGDRSRPWILKAQTHLGGLEGLVDAFPDATIVHCHRDIPTAMTSAIRTGEALRGLLADDIDLVDLGEDILRIYTHEMDGYVEQRDRVAQRVPIVDVAYRDIVNDPMNGIRAIYAAHHRQLSPETEAVMGQWSSENPQYRFGRVTYSPEKYGLTRTLIEQRFAAYIDRFGAYL